MQWDDVSDEHVTTPSGDHVEVEQSSGSGVQDGTGLLGLDPEHEGDHQQSDGDGFVIVGTGNGSGDITWDNSHERSSQQTSAGVLDLLGEVVGGPSGDTSETWSEQDTDVSDIDRQTDLAQCVPHKRTSGHQTWVQSTTSDSPQWVPGSVVEPVQELVERVGNQVLGGPEVKPRIVFMDDRLEINNSEKTGRDGCTKHRHKYQCLQNQLNPLYKDIRLLPRDRSYFRHILFLFFLGF